MSSSTCASSAKQGRCLPMKPKFRISAAAVLAFAVVLSAGCDKGKPARMTASSSQELSPDTVVATIGSENVTAAQLDEFLKPQLQQVEKQKFQIRKQGLEKLVTDKLIKAE